MTKIFVLKVFPIGLKSHEESEPLSYPFETWEEVVGYFSSLQKAENAIHDYIVLNNERHYPFRIHSFTIMEYVVDNEDNKHGFAPSETRRSYLPDGKLEETCLVSERCWEKMRGRFFGRESEEIRFKKGDIVELANGKQIVPCIVVDTPTSAEYVRERNKNKTRKSDWSCGDDSDDYYALIPYYYYGKKVTIDDIVDPKTSPYPLDVEGNSFNVFPTTIPVTDEIKETLQTLYHVFNTERMERFFKWEEENFQ